MSGTWSPAAEARTRATNEAQTTRARQAGGTGRPRPRDGRGGRARPGVRPDRPPQA
jgi:hypothetical protein